MYDINAVRKDFPILSRQVNGKPLVYLDNAATSQKPLSVIQALVDYYERYNANVHRGVHTLSVEATDAYEEARRKVAAFINARKPEDLIFVRNTTEAINLVAQTWAIKPRSGPNSCTARCSTVSHACQMTCSSYRPITPLSQRCARMGSWRRPSARRSRRIQSFSAAPNSNSWNMSWLVCPPNLPFIRRSDARTWAASPLMPSMPLRQS
jgi:hypothetical protein